VLSIKFLFTFRKIDVLNNKQEENTWNTIQKRGGGCGGAVCR
jgi:hypothetical protein